MALCDRRTRLLAVSSVQYARGLRLDLERLGTFCRSEGILLSVDGIQSLGAVPFDLSGVHPNPRVELVRNGVKKTLSVKIGKLQEEEEAGMEKGVGELGSDLGITVQELTKDLAESLGIDTTSGLIITEVEPGSKADEAGLRRGDLILEVDRQPVTTIAGLKETLQKLGDKESVLMLIKRDTHTRYIVLKK